MINSLFLTPAVTFLLVQRFEPAFDSGVKRYLNQLYYYVGVARGIDLCMGCYMARHISF